MQVPCSLVLLIRSGSKVCRSINTYCMLLLVCHQPSKCNFCSIMLSSNSGKCCAAAAAAVAVAGIGVGLWAWYTGRRIDASSGDGHCCGKGKQEEEEESSKALVCLGLMSGTSVDGIDAALCRVCVHRKQREQGKPCSCSQLRDKEGLVEGPLASVQLMG